MLLFVSCLVFYKVITKFSLVKWVFILGNFYVNFKLMWDPITSLVVSHAHGMESHKFWSIFSNQLTLAGERTKKGKDEKKIASDSELLIRLGSRKINLCISDDEFVAEFMDSLESQLDNPDHANFRCLLWKAMTYFADVCEARNRDISNLFLDFLQYGLKCLNYGRVFIVKMF